MQQVKHQPTQCQGDGALKGHCIQKDGVSQGPAALSVADPKLHRRVCVDITAQVGVLFGIGQDKVLAGIKEAADVLHLIPVLCSV